MSSALSLTHIVHLIAQLISKGDTLLTSVVPWRSRYVGRDPVRERHHLDAQPAMLQPNMAHGLFMFQQKNNYFAQFLQLQLQDPASNRWTQYASLTTISLLSTLDIISVEVWQSLHMRKFLVTSKGVPSGVFKSP